MSDKAEEEVWKQYPDYDFIEVSNLGNVRTKDRWVIRSDGRKQFVKGRVLKQQLCKNGYMYVHFTTNGKQVALRVNRMVAIAFIPNPHNYPVVNHLDNNRTNNAISNLEWCSKNANEAYKNNFGSSPAQVLGRPVFAVNLETGKVFYFESQSEAARKLGISQGDIGMVVRGERNQAGGYWFTENENEITEEKIREIKDNIQFSGGVIAVNPETVEIFCFESQHEAARQLGVSVGNLNMVIKGKRNKAGGYWFCRADKNAIEKVRVKFGDEIAKKVEELMKQNQKQ